MNLSQLRAAIAVADFGNFSEAALQLELSQPAVSHAIATGRRTGCPFIF
jgi:DNA-binding transcriptional LysR family regulator